MNLQDHFSDLAAGYARFRPRYPDSLFRYLASQCRVRTLAWDVGAGSGQASIGLAAVFDRVVATDASREQIAHAPRRPNIYYAVAVAEAAPWLPGGLDLVVVAQALHWFDREAFWREVSAVLGPGGTLAIWCYGWMGIDEERDGVIRHFYSEILGPYWPDRRRLVEEEYRGIDLPFAERKCPAFEMRERWDLEHLLGYLRTWSAVRAYIRSHGKDPLALLLGKLRSVWGPPSTRREIRWPLHVRICGKRAS